MMPMTQRNNRIVSTVRATSVEVMRLSFLLTDDTRELTNFLQVRHVNDTRPSFRSVVHLESAQLLTFIRKP